MMVMQRLTCEGIPAVAIPTIADSVNDTVPYDLEAASDSAGRVRL